MYADGRCDEANNKGACHYDGGDCCDATCQPTLLHSCPRNSFHCVDPDVYSCSHPMWSGDGWCDIENNTPACLWDGGDCCEDTCNNDHATFECGQNGYKCRDPDSEDHGSTDTTGDGGVEQLDCAYPEWYVEERGLQVLLLRAAFTTNYPASPLRYADGFCDSGPSIIGWHGNNVKSCNYDGGDCCASTCESAKHTCGQGGYDCVNPDAGQGKGASGCQYPEWKGNGRCDPWNNEASCQWDGGDCCPVRRRRRRRGCRFVVVVSSSSSLPSPAPPARAHTHSPPLPSTEHVQPKHRPDPVHVRHRRLRLPGSVGPRLGQLDRILHRRVRANGSRGGLFPHGQAVLLLQTFPQG